MHSNKSRVFSVVVAALAILAFAQDRAAAAPITGFNQTNLVSDIPGMAPVTDADLKNPWGIAYGPTTPFWISDNGRGLSTLYDGSGAKQGLIVTIQGAAGMGSGSPTGTVFNSGSAFNGDLFLFVSEDGVISGWRSSLGSTAEILANNSALNAIYKGVTVGDVNGSTYLYATDFHNGRIDVLASAGAPALTGSFTDPNLPSGFAPFNIQNIGGELYVTYALQDAAGEDDVPGPGNGFVDVFDLNGNLDHRLVSNGALNSPWGIAQAPAGFGAVGGDFLIGNFGDGTINVYDPAGNPLGALAHSDGSPIVNDGLWALTFGNAGPGFNPGSLYLTAGLNDETNGLFARIDPVPEPREWILMAGGLGAILLRRRTRARPRA